MKFYGIMAIGIIPVSTDGENWYNIHSGARIEKVYDFRISLLYEIAKMKYSLINQPK